MSDYSIIPSELIVSKIYIIRNKKVMLDRDLAALYGVLTKVFNQTVKRNMRRFPPDFMFQLNNDEFEIWRSQIVTSKSDKQGLRRPPYAFTEQGVAMLSSVLNSERAIQVNIQIMRAFTKLRKMALGYAGLRRKIDALEKKYDAQFKVVFDAIRQLMFPPEKPKKRIGFYKDGK